MGRGASGAGLALVCALVSGCSSGGGGPTNPGAGALFFDDFNGATLDPAWVALNRHGDYNNSELQCYVPSNVAVANGNLVIVSRAQSLSCGDTLHTPSNWSYTSGMVQWRTVEFTYGTVECRARMAGGKGTWPSIWLLGADCQTSNVGTADNTGTCNWPAAGSDEIDITEIKASDPTVVHQNVISGGSGFQTCTPAVSDVSRNWHVYQLVWAPGSLTWKVDGATTCTQTSSIPSHPMFLMINTAMGGSGGAVDATTLPETTFVDYVKVMQ
jgi:beta-glucanase (GH16 family)